MNEPVLQLTNYQLNRSDILLCCNINMALHAGQICQVTGQNGVGKTTLLMQIAKLLPHQNIAYNSDNYNIQEKYSSTPHDDSTNQNTQIYYCGQLGFPNKVIYISHQLGINIHLTVKQNLSFLLQLYGLSADEKEINTALSWVDLENLSEVTCSQLSAGQKRRVSLARLKLMQPEHIRLWLLDEPFTALDNNMIVKLQQRIQDFVAAGGAVLMSSHQLVSIANFQLNLDNFTVDYTDDIYDEA